MEVGAGVDGADCTVEVGSKDDWGRAVANVARKERARVV